MHNTKTRLLFFAFSKDAVEAVLQRRLRLSAPTDQKIGSGAALKMTAMTPQHW